MYVCGGLGDRVRFDEGNIVVGEVSYDVTCSSAEAVSHSIVQQVTGVNF